MKLFEMIRFLADSQLKGVFSLRLSRGYVLFWFFVEIFCMFVCIIGSLLLLWLFAPFSLIIKYIISFFCLIVVFDVFKSFVWVKWLLFKEGLE